MRHGEFLKMLRLYMHDWTTWVRNFSHFSFSKNIDEAKNGLVHKKSAADPRSMLTSKEGDALLSVLADHLVHKPD